MLKKIIIVSILIVFFSCSEKSKKENIVEQPELVTDFFKSYRINQDRAIDDIFTSSRWLRDAVGANQKDSLISQLKQVTTQLGKYRGYEVIKTINAGSSYKVVSTMAKYERQPVRFNFILYMPDSIWQVQNFTYDFNIEEELANNTNLSFDY